MITSFLNGLFSSDSKISSRRFGGMEVLQVVIIMVLGDQFFGFKINIEVLWILVGLVVAFFGLTTFSGVRGMQVKQTVASDIVESDKPDANKDAREVLAADAPK